MTNRERYVVIGVGVALGLLLLDQVVWKPYNEKRAALKIQEKAATDELTKIDALRNRRRNLTVTWDKMVAAGMKTDPAEAHSQLDRAIRDWELQSGVMPDQYKRTDLNPDHGFQRSKAHLVANGSTRSVSQFLWSVETTILPIRVDDLTITSSKEGTDNLKVEMDVSITVPLPDATKAPRTTVADIRGY